MTDSVTLRKLFGILRKNAIYILILTICAMVLTALVSIYVLTPVYEESTQILVNQERPQEDRSVTENIQADLQLITTYTDIMRSSVILNQVVEREGLSLTGQELDEKITIQTNQDSQVVNISVIDENPAVAVKIANSITAVFKTEIMNLMNTDNVTILSPAVLSENPSPININPQLNIVIAAIISLMAGAGLAFLFEYMNTTLKDEEDIADALNIPVLGIIPPIPQKENVKKKTAMALKEGRVN